MFGQAIARALPELRAAAESRMGASRGGSDVRVWREVDLDDDVLSLVLSSPARIGNVGGGAAPSRALSVPGGSSQVASRVLHLPVSVSGLVDGDLVEVVAGGLAGSWWLVVEADGADQTTAFRVPIVGTRPRGVSP